jgi:3'(2'), 5'-bisphosphate nucleotidase
MRFENERRVAVEAVLKAASLCRTVQRNLVSDESMAKKDRSPVTVADFGAQAVVSRILSQAFPNDPLIGEEDATELREDVNEGLKSKVVAHVRGLLPDLDERMILEAIDRGNFEGRSAGRAWTLDPIDGTKGFLRLEQYAVALSLLIDGRVVLGVLGCPNLPVTLSAPADGLVSRVSSAGCLFVAVEGQGAYVRTLDDPYEHRISVADISDPSKAVFCESVEKEHSSHSDSARVAEILGITAPPYRIDSQCKYGAVARGDASVYLRLPTRKGYEEKIWDHAAGCRVVLEAGGRVSDVRGRELNFSLGRTLVENVGVVVTNGRVHDAVIRAVRDVLGL